MQEKQFKNKIILKWFHDIKNHAITNILLCNCVTKKLYAVAYPLLRILEYENNFNEETYSFAFKNVFPYKNFKLHYDIHTYTFINGYQWSTIIEH